MFKHYLNNIDHEFKVIGVSETWLNGTNVSLFHLNGYNSQHRIRHNKKGGGVSLFIKSCIEFSLRTDLDLFNEKIETVFIEIKKDQIGSPKDVVIGTIYRPPKKPINLFTEELSKLLSTLAKENKILYLMGDYNINLLNADSHIHTSEFIETMYSFAFMPIANKPARIHNVSPSLNDNIYCYNIKSNNLIFDRIFLCDITDHFPVVCMNNFEKRKV